MKLARVIGSVVSTRKVESINNLKILLIQPLNHLLKPAGDPLAAIDTMQAGPGDLVHFTLAREAAFALPNANAPVDAAITGIVDEVTVQDTGIYNKENIFETE